MKEIFCKFKSGNCVTAVMETCLDDLWWKVCGECYTRHVLQHTSSALVIRPPHSPPPLNPHTLAKEMLERRAHLYTCLLHWPQRIVSHLSTFSSFRCSFFVFEASGFDGIFSQVTN